MLRVGVVGVGAMGADHAERLAHRTSGAALVAVADVDGARASALAARYQDVMAFDDPLQLITDDGVDAVVIASPGFVHEEQVLACIGLSKPTLCEKPLAMDAAAALRIVRSELTAERELVQVGFMRRFDPEYAEMKSLLVGGELGRTLLVHNIHRNRAPGGAFDSEMIVRDSLVHEVDIARWLFDEEITSITVLSPRPTSLVATGVSDPIVAIFQMAGGGLVTNEVFVNSQVGYEVRCEAVGEQGNATIGLGVDLLVRSSGRWGGQISSDFRTRFQRAYDIEVQQWVDGVSRGCLIGPTAWDGYAAAAVCTAGIQSLATGGAVPVHLAERPG